MKKLVISVVAGAVLLTACTELNKAVNEANKTLGQTGAANVPLSNADAVKGLKEALTQGANKAASQASQTDGFFKNPVLFIPFPPAAQKVKDNAVKLGMTNQVNKFEETLNRAAEEATKSAAPVFVNAIKTMSLADGLTILKGADTAATHYLRTKCTDSLIIKFMPIVKNATQKVELTKYWNPLATAYNKLPMVTPINPDLDKYVCERAVAGLFKLIGDEEKNIRTNPLARGSEILKKVFGSKENPHNQ